MHIHPGNQDTELTQRHNRDLHVSYTHIHNRQTTHRTQFTSYRHHEAIGGKVENSNIGSLLI